MKTTGRIATKIVGATSLAILLTTSAFADPQTYRRDTTRRESYSYRENDRVNLQGRITSFSHERNGYRVNLDRGPAFWVPESYFRNRTRDLRVGVSITLGGVFRGGSVYVDSVNWADRGYGNGYDNGFLRGTVDRVAYRRGTVWLRDERTGRVVEADLRGERDGRLDIGDIRRGDRIELSGSWVRGNIFEASRIDRIRNGRY